MIPSTNLIKEFSKILHIKLDFKLSVLHSEPLLCKAFFWTEKHTISFVIYLRLEESTK